MCKLLTLTTGFHNKTQLPILCTVVNCSTNSVEKVIKIAARGHKYPKYREFVGRGMTKYEYRFHAKNMRSSEGEMVCPYDVYVNAEFYILPDTTKSCGFRLEPVEESLPGGRHVLGKLGYGACRSLAGMCCVRDADTGQDSGTPSTKAQGNHDSNGSPTSDS